MAKLIYETGVTPIRGHRQNTVLSLWKGIPTARLRSVHDRYAWESPLNAAHRNETERLVNSWQNDVSPAQKEGWATYAAYLETLPTDYTKIVGWKNYGGAMSAMDAFILTNSLRFSIGESDILLDEPSAENIPLTPILVTFTHLHTPDVELGAAGTFASHPIEEGFIRLWIRGKRHAHLLLAAVTPVFYGWSLHTHTLNFAQGAVLGIPSDIYQGQVDVVTSFGRFSAPSNIKSCQTYDVTELGLWDARLWDALRWGNF
jgi:hypothetical protein